MITGMHVTINAKDANATQVFLRDKLGLASFDAGGGFIIFETPVFELACQPSEEHSYQISFFCDDIEATMADLQARGVQFPSGIREETWGRVAEFALPDGRAVLLYERKYAKG